MRLTLYYRYKILILLEIAVLEAVGGVGRVWSGNRLGPTVRGFTAISMPKSSMDYLTLNYNVVIIRMSFGKEWTTSPI
jgi:hypothetical protein